MYQFVVVTKKNEEARIGKGTSEVSKLVLMTMMYYLTIVRVIRIFIEDMRNKTSLLSGIHVVLLNIILSLWNYLMAYFLVVLYLLL